MEKENVCVEIENHDIKETKEISLIPYPSQTVDELSITVTSLQKAYSPLMDRSFAIAKDDALLMPHYDQFPVVCPNESVALENFSQYSNQTFCVCENLETPNTCHCIDMSMKSLKSDVSNQLPIETPYMRITREDMEIQIDSQEGEKPCKLLACYSASAA
ncbi:hypothetical protein RB195_006557 [Necator americanus]|uniref:Phlebovirus glycoprotein G2 fusion domain-containing protein n=1 Tax=Necator americanus TaxID=51031 RepID=A0ABR1BWM1_NECAM